MKIYATVISLLVVVSLAAKDSAPLSDPAKRPGGFHGIPWGSTENQVRFKLMQESELACETVLGELTCKASVQVGDVPTSVRFDFRSGRLVSSFATFPASRFDEVVELLTQRYGKPWHARASMVVWEWTSTHVSAAHDEKFADISFSVDPPPGAERAIFDVKAAKVTVRGHGLSSEEVFAVVAYYDSAYPTDPHASRSIGWRATKLSDGAYRVSLDYWNAQRRDVAEWRYEPKTKKVSTLNRLAEMLSWMPAE
jgi:hypothetical protein